jgi:hypothetical protein
MRVEMERWLLNRAKVVDAPGHGDIPPEWFVSVLFGLGSAGPGYMLKYPSLNKPCAWVTVHKTYKA